MGGESLHTSIGRAHCGKKNEHTALMYVYEPKFVLSSCIGSDSFSLMLIGIHHEDEGSNYKLTSLSQIIQMDALQSGELNKHNTDRLSLV